MKKNLWAAIILFLSTVQLHAQKKVEFPSKDGVIMTANFFKVNDTLPYFILCHQEGSGRAEYDETAHKFMKLNYNILAIDMRSGNEFNGIKNETALKAKEQNKGTGLLNSEQDIQAAIDYAWNKSKKKVVLVGSSYSASLVLKIAASDPRVKAVLSFSPAEYFGKTLSIRESIKNLSTPVFAASTKEEAPALSRLIADIRSPLKLQYIPTAKGEHGSKALTGKNEESQECWLSLLLFMKQLK
ncbi:MAG TPA: dienelactone hydrolase family protein [Bacteroidia bacterium]|nr:dienelactone hydrolase family protein [Bacteroidia bacterium]